jgi:hypothetical protein
MKFSKLTAARVREVLTYDRDTGEFRWKAKTAKGTIVGNVTGNKVAKNGFRYISIDLGDHLAQRLAWAIVHGEMPSGRLTFKNGDRADCRFDNIVEMKSVPSKSGYDHNTPEGRSRYGKTHRLLHPDHYVNQELKRNFGISLDDYNRTLSKQKGKCAICKKPETAVRRGKVQRLSVDHNHSTGALRGLLCENCNKGLGFFRDSRELLTEAAVYVATHAHNESLHDGRKISQHKGTTPMKSLSIPEEGA